MVIQMEIVWYDLKYWPVQMFDTSTDTPHDLGVENWLNYQITGLVPQKVNGKIIFISNTKF